MSGRRKQSHLDKFLKDLDDKFNVAKKVRKSVRAKTKPIADAFNIEKKAKKAAKRAVRKTKTRIKRAAKRQGKKAVKTIVKKATASRRAYDRAPVKPQAMLQGMYANGWTPRQIEVRFGISQSTQRNIDRGRGKRPGQKHLKALRAIKNRKAPLNYSETAPEGRRPRKSGARELKNHVVINILPGEDASWVREVEADAHRRGLGVVTKYWPDETAEPTATEPETTAGDGSDQAEEVTEPEPATAEVDDGPDVAVVVEDDAEVEHDADADVITDDDEDDWAEIDAAAEAEAMAEEDDYVDTMDPAEVAGDAAELDGDGDSQEGNAVTAVSLT